MFWLARMPSEHSSPSIMGGELGERLVNPRRSRSPPPLSSTSPAPGAKTLLNSTRAEIQRPAAEASLPSAAPEGSLTTAVAADEDGDGDGKGDRDDDEDDQMPRRRKLVPVDSSSDDSSDSFSDEDDDMHRQRVGFFRNGRVLPLRTEHGSDSQPFKTSSTTTAAAEKATENYAAVDQEGVSLTVVEPARQRKSRSKNSFDDNESELSEPDSNVHSPLATGLNELQDEIVVDAKTSNRQKPSSPPSASDLKDENVVDAQDQDKAPTSHYPKRKRTSTFANLSESKLEASLAGRTGAAVSQGLNKKASRQSLGGVKGVYVGQWRDSPVPDGENRHAVIGFIDVRDRLRTRIERTDMDGRLISSEYPLPPGPGGSWVTFGKIIFSNHLVGLDQFHIKEYVKLLADATEQSGEERKAAEAAAVKTAIHRVKYSYLIDNTTTQPTIAHGEDLPEAMTNPGRPDAKRRKVSGGFAAVLKPNDGSDKPELPSISTTHRPPLEPRPTTGLSMLDPLLGTRPTRILLGHWAGSSEPIPEDRHAVYGILGQNDMFRVKVVRETREGRFVGGNFPLGAGALWIHYEEVEFEPHLKPLSRSEVKEYCRVRQYQLDHGEEPEERLANEAKAVCEAQARIGAGFKHPHQPVATSHTSATNAGVESAEAPNDKAETGSGLRQSRRNEKRENRENRETRAQQRPMRTSLNEADMGATRRAQNESDTRSSESRSSSRTQVDNLERTRMLARREIARAEAAQGRSDRHAQHRERAAAMVADATTTGASNSSSAPTTNGRIHLHDSEDMQRLNNVWARQESLRMKAGSEDAKMYDGIKYERKATGPFTGKLVSQGTIINIDGEDYVEYRVLTKPSFF